MESTYKPELWHDLFVVIGGAGGGLVGLLFVVMSLHLGKIVDAGSACSQIFFCRLSIDLSCRRCSLQKQVFSVD
jgi:hypothetical protein